MKSTRQDQSESTISINGVNFSYTDTGEGKTTLVFIHPFPFNKEAWARQLVVFSRNYRVITYDIRGFGKSDPGNEEAGIDLFASDLVSLMDALGIEKTVACGLSMGGYILMNAVCRYPERFIGLIFADTQCIADSPENREKRQNAIEKIKNNGPDDYADGLVQSLLCKKTIAVNPELVSQVRSMIIGTGAETIVSSLKALAARKESCNALKNIRMPALVICGSEDTVTPLSQSELLVNTITGAKLEIIKDAGHLSNMERPDEFNRVAGNFLSGLGN